MMHFLKFSTPKNQYIALVSRFVGGFIFHLTPEFFNFYDERISMKLLFRCKTLCTGEPNCCKTSLF